MGGLWEVAPPMTWAILTVAASLFLAGFILLSHSLVRTKAHGDRLDGVTQPGRLGWTLRVGSACLLAGSALWAVELRAPLPVVVGLAVLSAGGLGLEAVALARRSVPD
jgi:hypothetical protein